MLTHEQKAQDEVPYTTPGLEQTSLPNSRNDTPLHMMYSDQAENFLTSCSIDLNHLL
jgi:hypothetical protein